MYKSIVVFILVCITLGHGYSQDYEVSFNGGETVIDSVIAINLTTSETVVLPGEAVLILRKQTTGIPHIKNETATLAVIYPAYKNNVLLNFRSTGTEKINIQISDLAGRIIKQENFTTSAGVNQYSIYTQQAGLYFVKIVNGYGFVSTKIIGKGQGTNDIRYKGWIKNPSSNLPLKSLAERSFVLTFTTGDIISYKFFSGKSITILNEEATESIVLTPEFHECVDYEGNSYGIVKIGDQWWMAQNLQSVRYADGAEIPNVEADPIWAGLWDNNSLKACCFYGNDQSLGYGALYTYGAAINEIPSMDSEVQGVCPDGWHLPNNNEWIELQNYLIQHGYNYDRTTSGNKIGKSLASTSGWKYIAGSDCAPGYNQTENNRTGFNAIPVGYRGHIAGTYQNDSIGVNWWSATQHTVYDVHAYRWSLITNECSLDSVFDFKSNGYSVRCIKNDEIGDIIVNFTADKTEVPTGGIVTFNNLTSGEPLQWVWDFGDCSYSTQLNPSHTYIEPGNYTVTLSIPYTDKIEVKDNYITVTETETGTVSDAEGNVYKSVKIGNQWWMAENLKSTLFADSTEINHITDNEEWGSLSNDNSAKAYCFYNNNESLGYGALYTYAAAVNGAAYNDSDYIRGICPEGWHIPAESEWNELENYLMGNGYNFDGSTIGNKIGKSLASINGWTSSTNEGAVGINPGTNNRSGFNGLPGGYRSYYTTSGEFGGAGDGGYWWMANEVFEENAMFWNLYYDYKHVLRDYTTKRTGLSVRCIKNNEGEEAYPSADFSADIKEVTVGGMVSFTDMSTNSPNKWTWNFGGCGEPFSNEQNPSHIFTREGLHTVTLIASNEAGSDVEIKRDYIKVTQQKSVVNDIEGNIYRTVKIGDQWWMAENLRSTMYANGTPIPHVTDNAEWQRLADDNFSRAYCFYNNDESLDYGALYTFAAAVNGSPDDWDESHHVQGVCPNGWHIPDVNEWSALTYYLRTNGFNYDGTTEGTKIAKSLASVDGWNESITPGAVGYDQNTNNRSGFNAFPGGYRDGEDGIFKDEGRLSLWWLGNEVLLTEDRAHQYGLIYYEIKLSDALIDSDYTKSNGYSVRCIKD